MRFSTSATIIDDYLQFSIADLKKFGYFTPIGFKSGKLGWSDTEANIGITVDNAKRTVTLDYVVDGERHMRYKVFIHEVGSNIGKGVVRYFRCPITHTLCRKLYLYGDVFVSRKAMGDVLYRSQVESKEKRMWRQLLGDDFSQKYRKEYYRGKLTPYGKRLRRNELFWEIYNKLLSGS